MADPAPKNADAFSLHSMGHDSAIQVDDHQEPHASPPPPSVDAADHLPAPAQAQVQAQEQDDDGNNEGDAPDDYVSDSGFDSESLIGDETDTLASSILHYRIENGRQYHAYRDGAYWGPNDEMAKEILDFAHHMYLLTLDRKLHLAPISNPQRILDAGTGTGIWAIDMADQYPSATVTGTDLSPIQPEWVPPNCVFEIDDVTLEWTFPPNHFDFVHVRELFGCVPDWDFFVAQAYEHIAPGGWIEIVEHSVQPRCDDDTMGPDHFFHLWGETVVELGRKWGKPFTIWEEAKGHLEKAGFVDVTEVVYKWPMNGWPEDRKMKDIGRWNQLRLHEGVEGFMLRLLTQIGGWSVARAQLHLAEMRRELKNYKLQRLPRGSLHRKQRLTERQSILSGNFFSKFHTLIKLSAKCGTPSLALLSPAYLTLPFAAPLATRDHQRLDQYESLQSPTSPFLDDDDSSVSSGREATDIEYDSDTASSIDSKVDQSSKVEVTPADSNAPAISRGNVHHVISSQFTSYGGEDTNTTIELKISQMGDPHNADVVFRWIHLEEDVMDFESFTETSLQVLKLSLQEKRMVKEKLNIVSQQHEKSFFAQYATSGRNMDPFVFQQLWFQPSPTHSHLNRKITVACFPFFLLEDHIKRIRLRSSSSHPPLTLLQSVVSSTEPERDMRQVVCRSITGQHRRCFYVGQLWCLIFDDDQIVTCARLPEQELGGDVVTIIKEPVRDIPNGPFIKQFTANFMEINSSLTDVVRRFEDIFKVTMSGRPVASEDWANVVKKAQATPVHLVLSKRAYAERLIPVTDQADDDTTSVSDTDKLFPWQLDEMPPAPGIHRSIYVDGINIEDFRYSGPEMESWDFASKTNLEAVSNDVSIPQNEARSERNDPNRRESSSSARPGQETNNFHALLCFSSSHSDSSNVSVRDTNTQQAAREGRLPGLLAQIDNKLLLNSTEYERKAYANCQPKTLPEVTRYLLAITRLNEDEEERQYMQKLSPLDTFFVAAVQTIEFFLPLEDESIVTKKYWGAVYFIIKNVLADPLLGSSRGTSKSMNAFKRVAHLTSILRKELSKPHGPDFATTEMPVEFRKAWMHCIRYLLLFRFKSKYTKERERHLEKCEAFLDRGRIRLWRAAAKVPLHRKEVATPLAVVTVAISNLIKDVNRNGTSVDIAQMYSQYWKELETQIKSGRMRTAQQDIVNLQQEVKAAQKTLQHQLYTLKDLFDKVEEQSKGWSELNNHAPRTEIPLLLDCINRVQHRIKVFDNINAESIKLEHWMKEQFALTKNRQENAIYAFTIVTVVFLPLSFVCSFLGMNTTGIRDMDSGQWVFWASALPLTFIVILLALLLTDELGHIWMVAQQLFVPPDEYGGFSSNGRTYWKIHGEGKKGWRDRFWKRKPPKQESLIPVNGPKPTIQLPAIDPWGKPYRRTQTYRVVEKAVAGKDVVEVIGHEVASKARRKRELHEEEAFGLKGPNIWERRDE
ncbi:hypothetical protein N0V90_012586 [Kalmusia sp. IMI 367209]|nr:hypothetical protein N0V90_012586 [Kalmusia sp. IMI 367209]